MQFITNKIKYFNGTVLNLWIVGKINWSKGTSKNPKASSLSAKCAIALCTMNTKTIRRHIKSSFPLKASQEIRLYESSGFVIIQDVTFVQQRVISCAMLTSKGHKSHPNNEPSVASLQKFHSKVTIIRTGSLFYASKRLRKTEPICAEENRDSMVNGLLALHRPARS